MSLGKKLVEGRGVDGDGRELVRRDLEEGGDTAGYRLLACMLRAYWLF